MKFLIKFLITFLSILSVSSQTFDRTKVSDDLKQVVIQPKVVVISAEDVSATNKTAGFVDVFSLAGYNVISKKTEDVVLIRHATEALVIPDGQQARYSEILGKFPRGTVPTNHIISIKLAARIETNALIIITGQKESVK